MASATQSCPRSTQRHWGQVPDLAWPLSMPFTTSMSVYWGMSTAARPAWVSWQIAGGQGSVISFQTKQELCACSGSSVHKAFYCSP